MCNSRRRSASLAKLVDHATKGFERLAGEGVTGLDGEGFLEATHGLTVHFFSKIRPAEIVVRKVARLVAARFYGLLQPGNRFIELAKFDQVRANIVVRVAEIRVEFDGALAFGDGIEKLALEMIGPAEKGVRFGRGMKVQRMMVELDGTVVIAFHLRLLGILQHFPRASQGLLIHGVIVSVRCAQGQRYEGASCAKGAPVRSAGGGWKLDHRTATIIGTYLRKKWGHRESFASRSRVIRDLRGGFERRRRPGAGFGQEIEWGIECRCGGARENGVSAKMCGMPLRYQRPEKDRARPKRHFEARDLQRKRKQDYRRRPENLDRERGSVDAAV